ncbi:MAG TPA: metallopeptidase TldD-related protein [Candidatus Baltobacteraceae bacterium]|jgi:TldD protein|nr:metallopeptidase TldD-related protein [Candidatus Baltobacteraceae bacterium]
MMKSKYRGRISLTAAALLAMAWTCFAANRPPQKNGDPAVLTAMQEELDRSFATLSKADPPAYFISYTISDRQYSDVSGSNGALLSSTDDRGRWLETQTRVGSYQLDDTHKLPNQQPSWTSPGTSASLDDDIPVLRREIWRETDAQYRAAVQALIKVRTSQEVQVQTAEGAAADFSHEAPQTYLGPHVEINVDRKPWEERVRRYTAAFSKSPAVLNSIATFTALATNQYQVNTEGTKLAFGQIHYRLELFVQSKAPDGMDIERYANFDWLDPKDAPDDKTVFASIHKLIEETEALDKAPLVDPYAGPALLTGRAAAVYFHEVFGHRAEGFRQKDITEGQTFTSKIGEQIFPSFISIKDDPTEKTLNGEMLLGYYPYDDEGVPAQDVHLVDNGVLKTFLMSRSPLINIPHSNGHGRRQLGYAPVARQGNLIVTSTNQMTDAQLRAKLIELIKQQGKPFGLLIDDIAGGFTFTGRGNPQAFQVQPLVVYKVFADGRPDELVRGVDIVGTPLVSLTKIVATGDQEEIFNGYCGAESGSVPVSAVAPAMLISEMEVQKKETSTDRPPILPPPAHDPEAKGQQ